jgi:hypothetical protein
MSNKNDLSVTLETPLYLANAESFRVFVPKPEKKNAEDKGSIPVRVRRITLNCKRSGATIKFPLTVRGSVATFGDSRETANVSKRRTIREMRDELARMVGEEYADRLLNVALYS